ncbi:RagB/SusD family nutrient uptake outer membrane protein [Cyclobacterium jeungdonense]|uniref:RagB/SusD family nutrient uptake outer membrane protein n=1 Tax=Cyclobacterium jeungdonense TaxID=708087 RepID=A0ABT8C8A7_9BACT|nr:RagB/SusD family nutrient uptake outer membrane protein [Cyclobacterium jeungdonense]MDN3688766.1 RagB/SusD family nutrient uptake outer membrane protein [Cyclobacterium jeungdonense]
MNRIKKYILSSLILLIGWGCTETLEVDPTSVITTNSFWRSENDAEGALMGMYVELRSLSQGLHQLGEHRSEILSPGLFGEGVFILHRNQMNADTPGHPDWSGFYRVINTANLILKYGPEITFSSQAKKDEMLAQAHAMRAYLYFVMTRTWGDLIIREEPTEGFGADVTQRERSPQSQVFQLIKSDLEAALQLFPDQEFSIGRSVWSKPATNALKGEVYLWTAKRMNGGNEDLQTALEALNEVDQADVALLDDFQDVFAFDNKGNEEIIMSIRHQDLEPGNYLWFMWIIGAGVPSNIDQETREKIFPIGGGQGLMVTSDLVRNQFEEEDSRRDASFFEIYTINEEGGRDYLTNIQQKFPGTIIGGNRVFLSDPILYRYADVLLMKAEAKNALGMDPSPEINQIRQRAYGDQFAGREFEDMGREANDEAILKERLLELVHEGKRWWDLVRFGKAFELVPALQDRVGEDHLLLFPISNSVLSQEPLVEQNPGY